VISRRTIVWFGLFVASTLVIGCVQWVWGRPCREWKAAHHDVHAAYDDTAAWREPDGTYVAAINPCTTWLWQGLSPWLKVCALAWLVSLIGFLRSLSIDVYRWFLQRKFGRELGAR
jgi:hypothetical protein